MSVSQFNRNLLDHIPSCPGQDDWAHRVFLTTNEGGQKRTLSILAETPLHGNTMIGVSGFFILNAAAVRGNACSSSSGRIENIILIDRSVRVEHFWEKMQGIITGSNHRLEVFEKVAALLAHEKHRYYKRTEPLSPGENDPSRTHRNHIQDLRVEMDTGQSWLSSDEKFTRIKAIFDQGRFIFKRADLTDVETFRSIGRALKTKGLHVEVDTVYPSNAFEYVQSYSQGAALCESLEQLVSINTLLVQTQWPRNRLHDPLEQIVYIKSGPNPDDYLTVPVPQKHPADEQSVSPTRILRTNPSSPRQKLSAFVIRLISSRGGVLAGV